MSATATVEASASTTVESSAAAMESAATVKAASAPARETASAVESTARKTTPGEAASGKAATAPTTSAPTPAATPASPTTPAPAIPRTGADEETVRKPRSPIIAVRSARIRIIIVIAVRTIRRAVIPGTHSHANADLRLRIRQRQHQHCNQSQIFHVPHGHLPCPRSALASNLRSVGLSILSLKAPVYLNSEDREKLPNLQWLFSARVSEFSRLRPAPSSQQVRLLQRMENATLRSYIMRTYYAHQAHLMEADFAA
jgi:hypothetical protein